ncbi:hypothetical protein [Clostridium sp.]|uniref:hypothetical protein n=1 Tax=Clostridium sp. TaxID=1506 RepID=UPI00290969FA|nr:hypothetical protein [Clostridium sp.]MDU3410132.1 hypothetical protein [Clostridium sp.]
MKRKSINKLILTLSIILGITSLYTIRKYINIKEQQSKRVIDTKDNTNLISKEIIIKQLNNENQMLVLSGETEVQVTYSNKDIAEDDVNFKWIKDWFSEMNSKDLKINATYTYQFHYDLKDLNITIVNNKPSMNLSKNRLNCEVELVENESIYADRVGVFESQFTPQEVNSINTRTKAIVLNKIQSDAELRNKAMYNVQKNIEDLLKIDCSFNVAKYDVVEYNNKILFNN